MRLKKLVLHGFKSFADRTEFKFDQPVTCVVGPNGCGKSNVVDAIKWVLGEQSAKSLRGGAMLDVIFNGADARKASGVAEVELVFENPIREDGNRLLTVDTDDVSVMRRLYRDGTSEYLINQQGGRLKDIKELFLDTGVGVDAYSIIEQGRVARLLEANPVERRQIFEEAAGISRFKVRKKEAQKKLEKVDDNLARLSDITKELESRLRSVKIQAGRARTYQELAARLGELRLQHALHEYRTLHIRLEKLRAKQDDAKFRFDDAETTLARSESELHEHRHRADSLGTSRQRAGNELIETRSKVQHAEQQANYARRQLEQFAEQATQVTSDREAMAARLTEAESLFAEAAASLQSLTEAVEGERKSIEEKREAHRVAQLRHNELNRSIEEHKAGYLDAMRKLAQVESRLSSIEIERRSAASQQEKLNERERLLNEETATLEATKVELANAIAELTTQVDAMQQQARERSGEQADVSAAIKSVSERLGAAREHRSGLLSRQKMLGDLEARREGISEAVQRVLKQRETKFPFIRGLVADLLRVDVEHAHVIEAALDGRDQWLVADPDEPLLENRAAFEELAGRVNVLRATRMQVIEHLPREEREAIREEQRQLRPSMNVVAQSEMSEYETDQAVSLNEDDAGIRFIPAGNVAEVVREDSRIIQVTGRLIDTLASSSDLEGSPLALTVHTSDEVYEDDDAEYDWNQHSEVVRFAIDLVRFEPADRVIALRLLGKTAVVESLPDALSLHREGPQGWRYVTRAGDVLEADGTYRVGPLGASMGILSRRSELEAVTHQIADVDVRINALADELAAGNEQAKSLDAAIAAIRQEAYRLNTVRVEQTSKLQQADSRLGVLGRERPLIDREVAQLAASAGKLASEAESLTTQRGDLSTKQSHHQSEGEALQGELEGLTDALRHAAEEATAARVRVGQLEEKQFAARQSVERLEAQRGEFSQQLERLAKAIESIVSRRAGIEHDLAGAEHQREVLATSVTELETRVRELDTQSSEATRLVAESQSAVEATRAAKSSVEQELHKLDVDLSEANVRMEGLVTRTQEEIQIDLATRYQEANLANARAESTEPASDETSEARVPQEQSMTLAIDWEAIATEIRQLKERIARLGNVNLDAIAELDELEHRQADYEAQVKDLADSKAQLESLIEQINADSSVRFEQTFQAVREHFQLMFRKLFGGGKADIVLETELEDKRAVLADGSSPIDGGGTNGPVMRRVDPLEAGIEVIARPPGKNPVTLSQLSGGEKAMTCIALLMSIFKAKPSPFCILDEVDAPLDEANNLRFTQIVQEFLSISQFIIITHHKKTMAIADQLYGITQQVHGVSTRVPVRFDQVDNTGRIKDEAIVAA
jgi:chromosome segregation protein